MLSFIHLWAGVQDNAEGIGAEVARYYKVWVPVLINRLWQKKGEGLLVLTPSPFEEYLNIVIY